MSNEPQVVHVARTERKRNPLGIVLCVAFLFVALVKLIHYHDWAGALVLALIGPPFLLVKENR